MRSFTSCYEWKQTADERACNLYIYDVVRAGEQAKTSSEYFRQELERMGGVERINLYINSLGGSCKEGAAIYSQLKRHPAHKTVYIDGYACSVASVIAMAGDRVVMPRNTLMMIHNAWTWAEGDARELRKAADDLDIVTEASRQAYLQKANGKLDEKTLCELMDKETYLTADQCIAYGLADDYGDEPPSQEPDKQQASGLLFQQQTTAQPRVGGRQAMPPAARMMIAAFLKAEKRRGNFFEE